MNKCFVPLEVAFNWNILYRQFGNQYKMTKTAGIVIIGKLYQILGRK